MVRVLISGSCFHVNKYSNTLCPTKSIHSVEHDRFRNNKPISIDMLHLEVSTKPCFFSRNQLQNARFPHVYHAPRKPPPPTMGSTISGEMEHHLTYENTRWWNPRLNLLFSPLPMKNHRRFLNHIHLLSWSIFYFHPEPWGNDPFDEHIFQMGCFNHHLVLSLLYHAVNVARFLTSF